MLIRAGHLWSPPEPPVEGGWLRLQRGGIAALGSGRPPKRPDEEVHEFHDAVLMPALVNAHAHLEYGNGAGTRPAGFSNFLRSMKEKRQSRTEAERMELLRKNAEASLRAGVGTLLDHLSAGAPGKFQLPAEDPYPKQGRFIPAFELLGGFAPGFETGRPEKAAWPAARSWAWAPHSTYLCGGALLPALRGSARISVHVAESEEEDELWRTGKGRMLEALNELVPGYPPLPPDGALGPLQRAGLLKSGTLLVHGNYLGEEEIRQAASAGAALVHCPASHAFFGHRRFPWSKFKQAGIPVLVGSDSAASGGGPDLAATLKLGLESSDASPEELWEAATFQGAKALGLASSAGRLALGYSADLVVIKPESGSNLAEGLLAGKVLASFIGGSRL